MYKRQPINYNFAPGEIAIVLEDSKPKVFLYDAEFAPKVEIGRAHV